MLSIIKITFIKPAIFNLNNIWNSVKNMTLVNVWKNLLSDEIENKLRKIFM